MTPEDLVKTGAQEVLRPFTELVTKLLGPAAEEGGETLRAIIGPYRLKRQLRFAQQADRMMKEVGIEPGTVNVPLKTLAPIVEHATLEDNDDLQDRWAALLANAAREEIHPSLSQILSSLSATDAKLLSILYEQSLASDRDDARLFELNGHLEEQLRSKGCFSTDYEYAVSIDNLVRLNLLQRLVLSSEQYWFTNLAVELVTNCTPPQAGQSKREQKTARPRATALSPIQRELETLKFQVITETVVNNYYVHLGDLKEFWGKHPHEMAKHPHNMAYFNEWLQHPLLGQRVSDPSWTLEKIDKLKKDTALLKIDDAPIAR
jgi:hypothetical protein